MENGLRIYYIEPLVEKVHYGECLVRISNDSFEEFGQSIRIIKQCCFVVGFGFAEEQTMGSVGFCEMVYRCNLFAIVSGGNRPKYADNSVLVYDDSKKRSVLEFTFNQQVLSVRCRRDRLVAVLKNRIHIFSFPTNPQKLFTIETRPNPFGLCELSPGRLNLLVFPGSKMGSLQLMVRADKE
jgi:hypothetical protein